MLVHRGRTKKEPKSWKENIKKLDIYPKTAPSAQKRSNNGVFVTFIVAIFGLYLLSSELSSYSHTIIDNNLVVDMALSEPVSVHFDITFHNVPCPVLQLDAMDAASHRQTGLHLIKKTRVDPSGEKREEAMQNGLGTTDMKIVHKNGDCLSCLDAELHSGQCCNSCDELKDAYRAKFKEIPSHVNLSEQCIAERKMSSKSGNGCNIQGFVMCKKGRGNLHVAAGESRQQSHQSHQHHVHLVANREELMSFNASHTIHRLDFGKTFTGMPQPLQNVTFIQKEPGRKTYFITAVPSTYEDLAGEVTNTNQISVTEHWSKLKFDSDAFELPGVYFGFDFYPLRVVKKERPNSFAHLVVRVGAIMGGMMTLMGWAYTLAGVLMKKMGKAEEED